MKLTEMQQKLSAYLSNILAVEATKHQLEEIERIVKEPQPKESKKEEK